MGEHYYVPVDDKNLVELADVAKLREIVGVIQMGMIGKEAEVVKVPEKDK